MVWIFIAAKNRYLIFSAPIKIATTQKEPKRGNATHNQQQNCYFHDQIFLAMSTIRQVLMILLLMEEALFTWAIQR